MPQNHPRQVRGNLKMFFLRVKIFKISDECFFSFEIEWFEFYVFQRIRKSSEKDNITDNDAGWNEIEIRIFKKHFFGVERFLVSRLFFQYRRRAKDARRYFLLWFFLLYFVAVYFISVINDPLFNLITSSTVNFFEEIDGGCGRW